METTINLLEPGADAVEVFALVQSAGRNEYAAAGQAGAKPEIVFIVWVEEYGGQEEIEHNGDIYTVYRTYNARPDGRMELYAEKRGGRA